MKNGIEFQFLFLSALSYISSLLLFASFFWETVDQMRQPDSVLPHIQIYHDAQRMVNDTYLLRVT